MRKEQADIKHDVFCAAYLKTFNAKAAAIEAGYSAKAAKSYGCNLLKTPAIQEKLQKMAAQKMASLDVSKDTVIDEIVSLAFSNIGNFIEWGTKTETDPKTGKEREYEYHKVLDSKNLDTRCVQSVEMGPRGLKIKLHDKNPALNVMAKFFKIIEDDPNMSHAGWVRMIQEGWKKNAKDRAVASGDNNQA